jgi:hypothetical protein
MKIIKRTDWMEKEIIFLDEFRNHPVIEKGLTDDEIINKLTNEEWSDGKTWVELQNEI